MEEVNLKKQTALAQEDSDIASRPPLPSIDPIADHSPDLRTERPALSLVFPASDTPTSPTHSLTEYDVELDDLHHRTTEHYYSTDRPVSAHVSCTTLDETLSASDRPSNNEPNNEPAEVPNYKPFPLRWHFSFVLSVLIAGIFAFLEYQINNLPPVHYSVLESYHPLGEGNGIAPTSSLKGSNKEPTFIFNNENASPIRSAPQRKESIVSPGAMLLASPRPQRPDYPEPFSPVDTYCGWESPVWALYPVGIGVWDNCSVEYELGIQERINTFITNDSSWYPLQDIAAGRSGRLGRPKWHIH